MPLGMVGISTGTSDAEGVRRRIAPRGIINCNETRLEICRNLLTADLTAGWQPNFLRKVWFSRGRR